MFFVGAIHELPLQAQELLDVLWSTDKPFWGKFSPDGKFVYMCDHVNLFKADALTGEISRTFSYYSNYLADFDFSPTGDTLVSTGGYQYDIVLWDTYSCDTLKVITSVFDSLGKKASPNTIKFTPDGKRLVVSIDEYPKIVIIEVNTGEIIKGISEYNASGILDVSPDGKFFAFHSHKYGYTIALFDLETYEYLGDLEGNYYYINRMIIPNNENIFACGFEPPFLYIWDANSRELINFEKFDIPEFGNFVDFAVTIDSKYVMVANDYFEDKTKNRITVFDIEKDKIIYTYPYRGGNIDISSEGYIIASDAYTLRVLNPTWKKYVGINETKEETIKHTFFDSKLKMFFDEEIFDMPEINIYNILGVNVGANGRSPVKSGNEIEIDLNYLNSGVYFVVVDIDGKRSVLKVMRD